VTAGVTVRDLSCTYAGGARPALAHVDCEMAPGTLTVVMGATGAGKSTLARCLTRIIPDFVPAALQGEVRLLGMPIDGRRVSELAGTIGMVFQDFEAQLFSTDVLQEVVFGLEHTGVPADEMPTRARDALAAVGLSGFAARDPATLSGGEKQRLAIAGLLALRPRIMVLDEPTTDLDPAGRVEVLEVLAGLRAEGLTVILIDHDPASGATADAVALLHEGHVRALGSPSAILGDVHGLGAAGVRAPDVARVLDALALPERTLDVDTAARLLRARGLVPVPRGWSGGGRPSGRPLLMVDGLRHRWPDGRTVLHDVGFAIHAGEFIAVVGRNGSGKTTLAKHLNGLLAPTTGRVRLGELDVTSMPLEQAAQRVGYVFQDPDHQLFASTVAAEVAFGPRNLGLSVPEVDARVTEALAAVGLDERDADPFLLDKGARQRLAVAAVLALRPEVVVLDEPTTGLDHAEQTRMLALLRRLHAAGRTIVIITHTPWVIAEHAERVLLLEGGRLRYDGPVREFFASPDLLAAAAFRPPDVTELGMRLGCVPLSVPELVSWMPGR